MYIYIYRHFTAKNIYIYIYIYICIYMHIPETYKFSLDNIVEITIKIFWKSCF